MMLRNSVLYRRMWYLKRKRTKGVNILTRLLIVLAVFFILLSLANKMLMPCLIDISETKAKSMVAASANSAINEVFSDNIRYEDLTVLNRGRAGNITSIETNVVKLNLLAAQVSEKIQQKLTEAEKQKIPVPFGSLFGNSIFSGAGPDLYIKVRNIGSVQTDYKSEFIGTGINQTKHKIYILVKTQIGLIGPITSKKINVIIQVPVAETVIVGEVPEVYLNTGN